MEKPTPEILEAYEQVSEGLGERVLRLWEEEEKHILHMKELNLRLDLYLAKSNIFWWIIAGFTAGLTLNTFFYEFIK